jgi:hypothetical protein
MYDGKRFLKLKEIGLPSPKDRPYYFGKVYEVNTSKKAVNILLTTKGRNDLLWSATAIVINYIKEYQGGLQEVMEILGLEEFHGDYIEKICMLYMINVIGKKWNVKRAREVCSQVRQDVISDFVSYTDFHYFDYMFHYTCAVIGYVVGVVPEIETNDEGMDMDNAHFTNDLSARELMVLAEYYSGNYKGKEGRVNLFLYHPYNLVLYRADAGANDIRDYVKHRERVIDYLGLHPSKIVLESDYFIDAINNYEFYGYYDRPKKFKIRKKLDLRVATDLELIKFVEKRSPETHIAYKWRMDLVRLAESVW